ncbi:hypothetical protein ACX7S9_001626 [Morganella morganii]|nr:hypothetical protein [Morganella morganii]HEN1305534.1 hypothetical protein [Klebsiella pneumoniae]EJD6109578.1 hypothetical protein [Morganella morganii]EJG2208647.1 hypothetical protein [Morganella morganii]EKU4014193.1 hypothetical protein [Morganella morganii]ELA7703202.1 hypothetical protein [Morganella morganii]
MKINHVYIKGLFGHLDYDLNLNELNTCIVTGPNGYGKTILLKIISSILNGRLFFFEKLTFDTITLTVDFVEVGINKIKRQIGDYISSDEVSYGSTRAVNGL